MKQVQTSYAANRRAKKALVYHLTSMYSVPPATPVSTLGLDIREAHRHYTVGFRSLLNPHFNH